jgi:hypothetical protein
MFTAIVNGLPWPCKSISITLECSKTVGNLKEAIFPKIAQSLKHKINDSGLSLHKVNFPDVLDVSNLQQLAFKAKKGRLLPSLKLSLNSTASPLELTVNILIELPPLVSENQSPKCCYMSGRQWVLLLTKILC